MRFESALPLGIELSLFIFLLLLLHDDAEELITLLLRLLGHHDLPLQKLLATGLVELNSLLARQLSFFLLLFTSLALSILESSLGSKSIDLSLTISCALL